MSRLLLKTVLFFTSFIILPNHLSLHGQNSSWTSSGPDGGHISCLTISSSNPQILYAGTKSGIYKTTDGGLSWHRTNFPGFYEVRSIQVHSEDPDLVMVGTYRKGLYRSRDGGDCWEYEGLWNQTINTLDRDPNDPDVLYFGTGEALSNPEEEFIAIYRIEDKWEHGEYLIWWENWDQCGWSQVNRIVIDPDSSNIIYAAGYNSGYCGNYGALLISRDSGATWNDKEIDGMFGDYACNLAMVKNSLGEKTLFVITDMQDLGTDPKLLKSKDLGESWEVVDSPYPGDLNTGSLMVHPQDPGTLIIGSKDYERPIWLYTEESDNWDFIIGSGLPPTIPNTYILPGPEETTLWYLATYYGGIYRSTGFDGRWDQINSGINNSRVNDFAVDPDKPSNIYAATERFYKLYRSTDGAASWEINSGSQMASFDVVEIDPNQASTFWAAKSSTTSYSLYKSENYGQNWTGPIDFVNTTPTSNRTEITDILVKPGDSETVYVSTQPYFLSSGLTGFGTVAHSGNGGNSWSNYPYAGISLAMDPFDADNLYVGKERSGQVFLFEADGNSMTLSNIEPEDGIADVQDLAFDHQGNLFVATQNGLWRADENGWDSLSCLANNITALGMDHSKEPSVIYAGSEADGVFYSTTSGESWIPFNNGLTNLEILDMEVSGQMLYASTEYGGIWARSLPETFAPPFLTHETGNLSLTVFQNGSLGHDAPIWTYGDGLRYLDNKDPLFNGSFVMGTAQKGFVNGQMGSYAINGDFRNTRPISGFASIPGKWDQVAVSSFDDASAPSPLGIKVKQRSYSNTGEDLVILWYTLESDVGPMEGLYAGIFADWDVGGDEYYEKNLGDFDLSRNLAYMYMDGGFPDPNYYGIVALEGISGIELSDWSHYIYIRESGFDWISTINETPVEEPVELKMWIGSGPFQIPEGESLQVCFAIVAGSNLSELQANAELAAEKYLDLEELTGLEQDAPAGFTLGQNMPNPCFLSTEIPYSIPYPCDILIEVFNAQGSKVKVYRKKGQIAGQHSMPFNTEGLEPGIYLYSLRAGAFYQTKTMLIN